MRLKLSLGRHREPQLTRRLQPEREHARFDVDPGDTRMSFIFSDGEHEQKIVHGGKWERSGVTMTGKAEGLTPPPASSYALRRP